MQKSSAGSEGFYLENIYVRSGSESGIKGKACISLRIVVIMIHFLHLCSTESP